MAFNPGTKFMMDRFNGTGNFGLWQRRVKDLLAQQGLSKALRENKPEDMVQLDWDELKERAAGTIWLCFGGQGDVSCDGYSVFNRGLREVRGAVHVQGCIDCVDTIRIAQGDTADHGGDHGCVGSRTPEIHVLDWDSGGHWDPGGASGSETGAGDASLAVGEDDFL